MRSTKVQDGIIRIEFVAGDAAVKLVNEKKHELGELSAFLKVTDETLIPAAAERVFNVWKEAKKKMKKGEAIDWHSLEHAPLKGYDGDVVAEPAKRLQTQPQHILNTLKKFAKEIEGMKTGSE